MKMNTIWPAALCGDIESQTLIETEFEQGNFWAGMLLAQLFQYNVAATHKEGESFLRDSMNALGVAFYRFWEKRSLPQNEIAIKAEQWAKLLNTTKTGLKIKVVQPGLQKSMDWMSYRPGVSPTVTSVESWAVMCDGIAHSKARVS